MSEKKKATYPRRETYGVSCCELAPLHQAVERGLQDHVFGRDFLLLHPFCRQLLEELREPGEETRQAVFSHMRHVCFLLGELESSHLLHTDLHAGFLRGSGGDLSVFVGLRGLHGESHHRSRDRRRGSVVVRDLNSKRSISQKQDDTGCQ